MEKHRTRALWLEYVPVARAGSGPCDGRRLEPMGCSVRCLQLLISTAYKQCFTYSYLRLLTNSGVQVLLTYSYLRFVEKGVEKHLGWGLDGWSLICEVDDFNISAMFY